MPPQLWHWKYFEKNPCANSTSKKNNNSQHYPKAWCHACILAHVETLLQKDLEDVRHGVLSEVWATQELRTQAFLSVPSVSGRRKGFEPHIRSCKWIDPDAQTYLAREHTQSLADSSSIPLSSAPDGSSDSNASIHSVHAPICHQLSKEQHADLDSDLCKLWVANWWAWHGINAPETQAFFQKWFPAVTLPDHHKLSGSILQRELESANSSMQNSISGWLATGMSDGWKNIKRNSLIASMLSVDYVGKSLNMINVWSGLLAYQTSNTGRHQLAHLAIHILSIVANLAGCERLFSKMGHIHTKRRSRLGYQKVFDTAVVRMNLKRKHVAEGRTQSRLKRQFGSTLDSAMSTTRVKVHQSDDVGESVADIDEADDNSTPPTMRSLATQFHQDVLDDEDFPESDREDRGLTLTGGSSYLTPLPRTVWLFFGTQVPVPLRDLFNYMPSSGAEAHGLDIFKSNGLANLQLELELYGLATQEMQKGLEADNTTE
ncbi:hypothetical protein B0J17DRAFT_719574 [Rhizoctonia solani]|nr:hypothetical protein B0J17DRAFT_725424 [Rhizoctonia solani]KAH7335910.1 hypothetical protein B0J17DRAFT_719574 [Rhizoctonia solani]